ncbi:polyamine ABC transporter ATP-binding protein [Microtetraspora sp. NBRC 16547]|uniref:polyamine ABC transporter ATP-binding protein n=1 Tax=Microtetraspora sp. NBRC 16547 TaxID=3030993 RepID=UPI0024A215BC|nr:hypothetical protein Misp02_21520 [Microtetraspora sp. NBRC 16547]
MTLISIDGVTRRFGDVAALDSVSLEIRQGEFFALLGPSGCGKTTLLRILAGFEEPDDGAVRLDGDDLLKIPAHRRPINLMFQSYALFPHMTVERNIAYGLEREKLPKKEIRERVAEVLETVGLAAQARRKPHQLSGGQRQRVALARAIVKRPRLLLLDEPLSALDKKVRAEMQLELKRLQHEVGITFVVVTHDQEEAMSLADRIAVMQGGKVEQVDAPVELYDRPRTPFVAGFIGANNIFSGRVTENGLDVEGLGLLPAPKGVDGDSALLVVRPENIRLTEIAPKTTETQDEAKDAAVTTEEGAEPKAEIEAGTEAVTEEEPKSEAKSEEAAEVVAEEGAKAKEDGEAKSEGAEPEAKEIAVVTEADAEVKPKRKRKTKSKAKAEPEVREIAVVTEPEVEVKAEPEAEVKAEAEAEAKAEADVKAEVATESEVKAEEKDATADTVAGAEAVVDGAAEVVTEVAAEVVAEENAAAAKADRGDDLRAAVKTAMTGEVDAEAMAEVVSRAVAGVVAKVVAEVVAEVVAVNESKAKAEERRAADAEAETPSETAPAPLAETASETKTETEAVSEADPEPEPEDGPLRGTVVDVSFYGGTSHIVLRVEGHEDHVLAAAQGSARVEPGTEVAIGWDAADAVLIPA